MSANRYSVEVILHSAYGNERFYPCNSLSMTLCSLMKSKSMTRKDLEICKKAGWEVLVVMPAKKYENI